MTIDATMEGQGPIESTFLHVFASTHLPMIFVNMSRNRPKVEPKYANNQKSINNF